MTDFDRTSNSETANILSTSCDKLLVTALTHSCENLNPRTGLMTHEEFTLAAIEDTPDLALRMAASYSSGEGRLVCFLIGEECDLKDVRLYSSPMRVGFLIELSAAVAGQRNRRVIPLKGKLVRQHCL